MLSQSLTGLGKLFVAKDHLDVYNILHGPHKIIKIKLLQMSWILKATVLAGRATSSDPQGLTWPVGQSFPTPNVYAQGAFK